jgi:sugar phosphate isomerase/epimerase
VTRDNDILKRCGLCQTVTPTQSVAEDCALYAQAGFGAVGISLHKLERGRFDGFYIPEAQIPDETVVEAAAAARRSELEVSHLIVAGFYTLPDLEARIAHTLRAMEVGAVLGAKTVVVAPGRRGGRTYEDTRDYMARALTTVFERATTDVRLALEPVVPWHSDYLNTLAEALDLADLVGHPNLGVFPDTFHLWRTGTMMEDVERAGSRIFGVHLNDACDGEEANRLPGDGDLPLVDIVRAIEATGYVGTYDNEYMVDAARAESEPDEFGPAAVVARCARAMSSVISAVL